MNVYDFDKTIYKGDSSLDLYLYVMRHRPYILLLLPYQLLAILLYTLRLIDKTAMKEHFFSFLAIVNGELLVKGFWAKNEDKIYDWYLKQKRPDDIIISASPYFLLKPICRTLGIRWLIASQVDVRSGRFEGKNCYGEEKLRRLRECFEDKDIACFYSDSRSDLPLARIAKEAFIVKNGRITPWNKKKHS